MLHPLCIMRTKEWLTLLHHRFLGSLLIFYGYFPCRPCRERGRYFSFNEHIFMRKFKLIILYFIAITSLREVKGQQYIAPTAPGFNNQVQLTSTAATATSTAMRNKNVGIGCFYNSATLSANANLVTVREKLHIRGSYSQGVLNTNPNIFLEGNGYFYLGNNYGSTTVLPGSILEGMRMNHTSQGANIEVVNFDNGLSFKIDNVYSQNPTTRMNISNNGDVAIGTTGNNGTLTVHQTSGTSSGLTLTGLASVASSNSFVNPVLTVDDATGEVQLVDAALGGGSYWQPTTDINSIPTNTLFYENPVLIGPASTAVYADASGLVTNDYGLYVSHPAGILATKMRVALPGTAYWNDKVFTKEYCLPSLAEKEKFMQENQHLLYIPAATELTKEGIDMMTMLSNIVRELEETELHLIEMNKKVELLEVENAALKTKSNQ